MDRGWDRSEIESRGKGRRQGPIKSENYLHRFHYQAVRVREIGTSMREGANFVWVVWGENPASLSVCLSVCLSLFCGLYVYKLGSLVQLQLVSLSIPLKIPRSDIIRNGFTESSLSFFLFISRVSQTRQICYGLRWYRMLASTVMNNNSAKSCLPLIWIHHKYPSRPTFFFLSFTPTSLSPQTGQNPVLCGATMYKARSLSHSNSNRASKDSQSKVRYLHFYRCDWSTTRQQQLES